MGRKKACGFFSVTFREGMNIININGYKWWIYLDVHPLGRLK